MSESARKKQRITPRNSEVAAGANAETPYNDLHLLAGVIQKPITPFRRALSAGPTPENRRTPNILIRTPGVAARTPRGGPATRPVSARRAAPTTPHAIRALRERANAARTPGRRRSGRVQRETPRDTLRALSRTLAQKARPIEPSPQVQDQYPRNPALDLLDDEDDHFPAVPRLSMPLEDMYEDDSFHEAPPRQSLLPDLPDDVDNGTIHSLEFGRRALSEDPRMMFTTRVSERFADLNELGITEEEFEIDGTFINQRRPVDADQLLQEDIEEAMDDTGEIQALTGRRNGRPSDVDLGIFGELDEPDEPTFRFTIPQRIRASPQEVLEEQIANTQFDEDANIDTDANLNPIMDDDDLLVDDTEAVGGFEPTGWESDPEVGDDADLQAYREEQSAFDRSLTTPAPDIPASKKARAKRQRRELHISKFGHEYPSFPAATVKKVASGLAKSQGGNAKISADTLAALVQTSDWFFEQIGDDLAAYAQHAGRKPIEDLDVVTLMKRQRQITDNSTVFSLAQKMLPRELLQELRMHPMQKLKKGDRKRKRMETIAEEEE